MKTTKKEILQRVENKKLATLIEHHGLTPPLDKQQIVVDIMKEGTTIGPTESPINDKDGVWLHKRALRSLTGGKTVYQYIDQVKEELSGMYKQTCGVDHFDYRLGANEALDRLKELLKNAEN
jgi:hypothetical protein